MISPGEVAARGFLMRCTTYTGTPNTRIPLTEWVRRSHEWAERAGLPGRPTDVELCRVAETMHRGPKVRHFKVWLCASDIRRSYRGRRC